MDALTFRALSLLPSVEQSKIRALAVFGDLDDLVQNAWLATLEAKSGGLANVKRGVKRGDSVRSLADRARSRSRRYTQDPVYYSRSLESVADVAADGGDDGAPRARKRREITREVTADFGVGGRRARQIVAAQIERVRVNGDLFLDDGSDGDDDGEDGK